MSQTITRTQDGPGSIPLAYIKPSKTNPRRNFDKEKLDQLADSIRKAGVLQPVLVRTNGTTYELVAGERRLRAAKLAELETIPAIVRELTDQEVLEIQVVENLQRDDLHPLEEAEGYRHLLAVKGYDAAKIAERIGRSVKYVYDRAKLLSLIDEVQKIFLAGKITAGHAILLARLSPADQERAIDPDNTRTGLWEHERSLFEDEAGNKDKHRGLKACSVRELQGWIDDHVKFDAEAVEPMLFPETARTLQVAQEEAEKIVPITHEHYVQPDARSDGQRIIGPRSWKEVGKKPCERAVTGVIVVGDGRGQALKVCTDKKRCTTHWGKELRQAKQRAAGVAKSGTTGQAKWELEEKKRKEQREHEDAERLRFEKARPVILDALAEKVKKAPGSARGHLADLVIDALGNYQASTAVAERYVTRGKTAEDLVRHVGFIILMSRAKGWQAPHELPKLAKAFGVDVKKIVDQESPMAESKPVKGKAAK